MGCSQIIDELQYNLEGIRKQHILKRLRRFLKFLVIGFFIGRDSDLKIATLTARNRQIIEELLRRLEDLKDIDLRIKEFSDTYTGLVQFEKKMRAIKEEVAEAKDLLLSTEEELIRFHEMLVTLAKTAIEHRESYIAEKIEEMTNSGTYLVYHTKENFLDALKSYQENLEYCNQSKILDSNYIDEKKEELEKYRRMVLDYNRIFVEQRKKDYDYLWKKGPSLDDEQQTAVVTDDKHNLVVAAAGSGKTEVLITRIAYLIDRKPDNIDPKRILAIAYQRKAKEEIEQRLRERFGIANINVSTFHKLGKDIVEDTEEIINHI